VNEGDRPPLDPEAAVQLLIDELERARSDVLPSVPVPPTDAAVLDAARSEARDAAERAGVGDALSRGQQTMAQWTLRHYRREGFEAAYLGGWLDAPEVRLEVADVMVDAATAVALAPVLPDETRATLMDRFLEWHGGPPSE
jgi:hypothetical protein